MHPITTEIVMDATKSQIAMQGLVPLTPKDAELLEGMTPEQRARWLASERSRNLARGNRHTRRRLDRDARIAARARTKATSRQRADTRQRNAFDTKLDQAYRQNPEGDVRDHLIQARYY